MLAVPVPVGTTLYQIVFDRPDPLGTQAKAEAGVGSFVSVVAPELSFVSANPVDVMLIALEKLLFTGGGATTVKVGKVTGLEKVVVVPPPGGGFWTPTEFVLPKFAMKLTGTVAVSCVGLTKLVVKAVPPKSGFMSTFEFEPKFVPVTVMVVVVTEPTGALAGVEFVIVGAPPSTEKMSALLVAAPTLTVISGVPPPLIKEGAIVAVNCVSLPPPCVTPVVAPFHCTAPPISPLPFTVNKKAAPPDCAKTGEIEAMCGPENGKLFRTSDQAPRPCVVASSVREGSCSFRESTATLGSPLSRVDHVAPPSIVA